MDAGASAASDAAIAEPTPPAPTTRHDAPATRNPLRFNPRVKPAPSNMSPSNVAFSRRKTALHDPATFTVVETSSSNATVVTLCGIVISAPRILVSRNSAFSTCG